MDVAIVERAMQGDRAAFDELVRELWPSLVRLARGIVGDADAEDAVQDALVTAGAKLPALRDAARFAGWVRRIVARTCVRQARRRRWWRFRLPLEDAGPLPDPDAGDPGVEMDVERVLSVLPARQRAVLYLTAIEGRSDSDIAEVLGSSPATVRSLRRHARRRLQDRFAAEMEGGLRR
jgi:RNA polymerase sigma-70 factor (ECF subfamily)